MSEIVFAVLDVNDNAPTFLEAPYKFRIKETVAVGDVVFSKVRERGCVSSEFCRVTPHNHLSCHKMAVADADAGPNAVVSIECVVGEEDGSDQETCDTFEVRAQELREPEQ